MSQKRVLFVRLSSLGDVVLATSSLMADCYSDYERHFLTSSEFKDLFKGDSRVSRLFLFNRKKGFKEWLRTSRELFDLGLDEVVDLHRSLRTFILRFCFRFWYWMPSLETKPKTVFRVFSKSRIRLPLFYLFKANVLAPPSVLQRIRKLLRSPGIEPRLEHLLTGTCGARYPELQIQKPWVVMPSAAWPGKRWGHEKFFEILKTEKSVVVLGQNHDQESVQLVESLRSAGVKVWFSAEEKWELSDIAEVLSLGRGYLGNDSGFAHMAEAVGVSAYIIYGPTVPQMGFGPWRKSSRTFGADLWCRPCSKDGTACFRTGENRFLCQKLLRVEEVSLS